MKNVIITVLVLVLALLAGQLTVNKGQPRAVPEQQQAAMGEWFQVAEVYDGDTFRTQDGQKIRLIGIDTPETHVNPKLTKDVKKRHSSQKVQLALGHRAANYVRSFLEGQEVRLEYDVEKNDRYGRTLAYVYLKDGTFVNEKIIQEGYAYPLTIPPNVRHADRFARLFNEAQEQQRGLWQ